MIRATCEKLAVSLLIIHTRAWTRRCIQRLDVNASNDKNEVKDGRIRELFIYSRWMCVCLCRIKAIEDCMQNMTAIGKEGVARLDEVNDR
jgi:hypothetical protein